MSVWTLWKRGKPGALPGFEPLFVCCSAASMVTIQTTFLRPAEYVEICGNLMGMINLLHCNYECASVHWVQIAQYMIQHRAHSNEAAGPITCRALLDRICYHHLTKDVLRGLYNIFVTSNFPTAKFIIQQQKRSENYMTGNSIIYPLKQILFRWSCSTRTRWAEHLSHVGKQAVYAAVWT